MTCLTIFVPTALASLSLTNMLPITSSFASVACKLRNHRHSFLVLIYLHLSSPSETMFVWIVVSANCYSCIVEHNGCKLLVQHTLLYMTIASIIEAVNRMRSNIGTVCTLLSTYMCRTVHVLTAMPSRRKHRSKAFSVVPRSCDRVAAAFGLTRTMNHHNITIPNY